MHIYYFRRLNFLIAFLMYLIPSVAVPLGVIDDVALYNAIDFRNSEPPQFDVFARAVAGYEVLDQSGKRSKKNILTIIDFRMSSNKKSFG